MKFRTRSLLAAGVLLAAVVILPAAAQAGCKQGKTCVCGDKVRGAVKLTADLTGCGRVGLKLDSDAILDCDGHEIRGSGPDQSAYGVRFDDVSGAEVKNCRIRGFRRGIRVRGGEDNRIVSNVLEGNDLGIEIAGVTDAGTASGHRIEKNEVRKSRKDGIHVGGAEKTVVAENRIADSGDAALHVETCKGCEVRGNEVDNPKAPALYVKHSSGGKFVGNTLKGGLVQIRGDSSGNEFKDNVLVGSAFLFEGYRGGKDGGKGDVVTLPHGNTVVGGSVEGRKICFRFEGAHDNVVRGVHVKDCRPFRQSAFGDEQKPVNQVEVIVVGPTPVGGGPAPMTTCTGADCPQPGDDKGGSAGAAATPIPAPGAADPSPLAGLTEDEQRRFRDGLAAFLHEEEPETGLGPVFNGTSCAECHYEPATGGASDRTVRFVVPEEEAGGAAVPASHDQDPPVRSRGIRTAQCSVRGDAPPPGTTMRRRVTLPLFGAGLVEMIPDDEILRRADPADENHDGISGRPNRIAGRVGRFGWKAQEAELRPAVARQLRDALGITSPVLREEGALAGSPPPACDAVADPEDDGRRLDALVDFLRYLAPLPATGRAPEAARGEKLFADVGCAACHVPSLTSGDSSTPPLARQAVPLYSDLLLHDLGPKLADGIVQGDATGSEFRTAPLWGIAGRTALLHDGRAPTIGAAISLHEGEGTAARDRYLALPQPDRKALLAFLESL